VNKDAQTAAEESLALASATKDTEMLALAKLQAADVQLCSDGDHGLAVTLAQEAMATFASEQDLQENLAMGSLTIARACSLQKASKQASVAAMQAAALAAEMGDANTEAEAWLLAATEALADDNIKDALSSAFVAERRFSELGAVSKAATAASIVSQIREKTMGTKGFLPKSRGTYGPYPDVQLGRLSKKSGGSGLNVENSDTIVCCSPCTDVPYVKLVYEICALINIVMNSKSKARLIIMTRGVHSRQCGLTLPQTQPSALSSALWAVGRCTRLDNLKFPIMIMDVAPQFTGDDIARCLPFTETDVAWYPA